jgi:hypothetical protein
VPTSSLHRLKDDETAALVNAIDECVGRIRRIRRRGLVVEYVARKNGKGIRTVDC